VEWYDLQTELVDHLANAIEQQWQENPKILFEDALQMEFKKFGVFGFMDVVEKDNWHYKNVTANWFGSILRNFLRFQKLLSLCFQLFYFS
jgi:hypothetical protein